MDFKRKELHFYSKQRALEFIATNDEALHKKQMFAAMMDMAGLLPTIAR